MKGLDGGDDGSSSGLCPYFLPALYISTVVTMLLELFGLEEEEEDQTPLV
jgi:hypothetical protein